MEEKGRELLVVFAVCTSDPRVLGRVSLADCFLGPLAVPPPDPYMLETDDRLDLNLPAAAEVSFPRVPGRGPLVPDVAPTAVEVLVPPEAAVTAGPTPGLPGGKSLGVEPLPGAVESRCGGTAASKGTEPVTRCGTAAVFNRGWGCCWFSQVAELERDGSFVRLEPPLRIEGKAETLEAFGVLDPLPSSRSRGRMVVFLGRWESQVGCSMPEDVCMTCVEERRYFSRGLEKMVK